MGADPAPKLLHSCFQIFRWQTKSRKLVILREVFSMYPDKRCCLEKILLHTINLIVCLTSQELNWSALGQKRISAPFTPSLANGMDVKNISEELTTHSSSHGTAPLSSNNTFRVRTNVCPTLHVMLKDNFSLKLSQLLAQVLETAGPAV
jgi:hypothetical protein